MPHRNRNSRRRNLLSLTSSPRSLSGKQRRIRDTPAPVVDIGSILVPVYTYTVNDTPDASGYHIHPPALNRRLSEMLREYQNAEFTLLCADCQEAIESPVDSLCFIAYNVCCDVTKMGGANSDLVAALMLQMCRLRDVFPLPVKWNVTDDMLHTIYNDCRELDCMEENVSRFLRNQQWRHETARLGL